VLALFCLLAEGPPFAQAGMRASKQVEQTIRHMLAKDPGLKDFFDTAYAYAVFPTIVRAGVGIGGAQGHGQVFEKGVLIGSASVAEGSVGLQLGSQTYSEIIFFEHKQALERFKRGNLELAAQPSTIAVAAGAADSATYAAGIAVFTLVKTGFMYEASVGAQVFKFAPKK
jgi:lipid-binding SYLF domain-containing protein